MLAAFGLSFALIFLVVEAALFFGLPLTPYRGLVASRQVEALASLAAMADDRKKELESWIEERRRDLMVHAEHPSLQQDIRTLVAQGAGRAEKAAERIRRHFANVQKVYFGEYEAVELVEAASGSILTSTAADREGSIISHAPYFLEARNPAVQEVIMVVREEEDDAPPSLVFCRGIRNPSPEKRHETMAVLVFRSSMRKLADNILHQGVGRSGEIILVGQDGRVVAPLRYPSSHYILNPLAPMKLAGQGIETVLPTRDYRGAEVLAATRYLPVTSELGWGLVVKLDRAEVLAPVLQTFFAHFIIVGAALLICGAVLAFLASYFARPLADLGRAAAAIEGGDFSVQTSPSGSSETWAVARAFNAMAQRLEGWHSKLTNEVQKRTRELVDANVSLQESEARFRSLFENVHVVTLLVDPEDGAIVDANEAAAAFYGWSREELRSMNIEQINTLSPVEIRAEMEAAVREQRNYFQFTHRLSGGSAREVEVYSGPIQSAGRTILCSIIHDITPRKEAEANRQRLEEQLRQAAKMEAVGRLAGGVAHDFNNMLGVILGLLEFLKMDHSNDRALMEHLKEIEQAASRSKEITRQLLGFSRKQEIAPKPVDPNQAVAGITRNLGRLIGEDIELVIKPGEDVGSVLIDPAQLDQVLMNLAVNARDAMPSGGKLIIETDSLQLDEEYCRYHPEAAPGHYVLLTLSDTGVGMDGNTLKHIFEPFFTTKEKGRGTGLGLATVFGIVQQNKGFINVYSEPGQGTTFHLYLPRQAAGTMPIAAETEEGVMVPGSGTILLVEDDPALCEMTMKMLQRLGYTVLSTTSPQEALERSQTMEKPPDLLLTDVVMPGTNGRELREALSSRWPSLRTLFMSGYTADLLATHQLEGDSADFLPKPFTLGALSRKVRDGLKKP